MNPLEEFLKSKRANDNRGLQKGLRELDNWDIGKALQDINEKEREILYRNMTKRATMLLKQDIDAFSNRKVHEYNILEIQKFVADMLIKFTRKFDEPTNVKEKQSLPEINLDTYDDIIKTFENLSTYARS